MGTYLNPGNSGFAEILRNEYIDKTGLISLSNSTIDTKKKLTCISRPRRLGKSFSAQMLCAYYDRTCYSHGLFVSLNISRTPDYEKYINKFHVVNLDISGFVSKAVNDGKALEEVPSMICGALMSEIMELYPEIKDVTDVWEMLLKMVEITETKIIFIIDEWDSLIREAKDEPRAQASYLHLLRNLFKNGNFTPRS